METDVPSMIYPARAVRDNFYGNSELLTEKADHLRLQYINFNYRLHHDKLLKRSGISANVFFNIDNVGILWRANRHGIDPDFYSTTTPPPPRIFSVGLTVNM